MKRVFGVLFIVLVSGCGQNESEQVDTAQTDTDPAAIALQTSESDLGTPSDVAIITAFKPGEPATLEIPEMSCQINCYPKVKEALEGITGVKSVELMPQEDEVVINDHRVKIEFDGDVDGANAVAALTKAGYPGATFQN